MDRFSKPRRRSRGARFPTAWLALYLMVWAGGSALAHEVWIETAALGRVGQEQEVCVCWGHSGHREGGERLKSQASKLTSWFVPPNSPPRNLALSAKPDCFSAMISPTAEGGHAVAALCQVGILDREFHGIPAKTRIVMAGKTVFQVGSARGPAAPSLGLDLEMTPVGEIASLRPGGVVAVKVLFKKTPIGGSAVAATLSTLGKVPFPKDTEVEGLAWSVKNTAHPATGEVRFPLITAGRHIVSVRYTDETPGRYEGPLEFATDFSHLRQGDTYERTLYVSTLAFDVASQ